MAFLAQLTTQTEELVTAVTSLTFANNAPTFASLREVTLKSLRHHNNLRTNRFEVESQLDGLVERFSVAGRDELADALRERREALAQDHEGEPLTTQWTPDILHFLLELSDRPTGQPHLLDDLNALVDSRRVQEPPPLRWEDISREDGWGSELDEDDDEEDNDIYDYKYEDDSGKDDDDDDTTMSSVGAADDLARTYRDLVATDEHTSDELAALLAAVRKSQAWRTATPAAAPEHADDDDDGRILLSELQILRETMFMLQGLETTLFGRDCVAVDRFRLSDVSSAVHTSLLASVAASGRKLLPLRRRAKGVSSQRGGSPPVPLLQVFEEAIRRRLHAFDEEVTQMQARFLDGREGTTVISITAVLDELQPSLRNLFALAAVVQTLDAAERSRAHAFRYLEILFDATSVAQYEGDDAVYSFLGTLFFECFQVYLRPIRAWMEDGVLDKNDKIFFVSGTGGTGSTSVSVPLNQIWHSQFKLLRTSTGTLHAPRFLQPAASKIFTTGKSIVVLRQLGKFEKRQHHGAPGPVLDYPTVCPPDMAMAPFAQLFGDAFERWIQSKHHAASATLQATLFDACGLWASLEAMHRVYLMADGAAVDAFASRVFHSLDTRNPRWLDRYTMTELAREAFAAALAEESRLSVTVDKKGLRPDSDDPAVARRSVRDGLARIRPTYRLAWPVQIIIPADTIRGYQAVFTLLLQIRRANAVLSQHRLLDDDRNASAALYFSLRTRLLWFCNTLQSYLATLVIAPRVEALRAGLQSREGADVDAMIAVHDQFVRALVDEALLGTKLLPLHAAVLDLLDMALRLEDAHKKNAAREASALQETWRLSVLSVPAAASPRTPRQAARLNVLSPKGGGDSVRRTLFMASPRRAREEEDDEDDDDYDYNNDRDDDNEANEANDDSMEVDGMTDAPAASYEDTLRSIRRDVDSTLRFLAGGLRGVARASRNATAATKWDMLAETLGDDGSGRTERSRW